ncbi:TonB-dependent receptor [Thalassotalea fonticola]|uniref:TonB-dependent receptor n=1 Tax=Thalassotalea fonticola TaxID=3065649 RepID=A0ABZ0GL42_9GAMM|nr:TonB-dependent receptor [Colwelliaceae bacterium S1-1]
MKFNKSSLSILISAIITGSITPCAFAQENTNEAKTELTSAEQARALKEQHESEEIERIIVQGYEASLDAAEENKRNADQFLDAVSASGLGEFADDSVGDTLNGIAGVDIDSNDGIADGIYVGGLPPEYNQIQVNGNTLGAGTNDSASFVSEGATTSGIFSTAVLSGLEVFKSARADKSEGSLGGTVNFKTWKPLNFKKPKFNVNLTAGYHEMDESNDGKASFLYGDRTNDEKFGWVITASHDITKGRIDTFSASDQKLRIYDLRDSTDLAGNPVDDGSRETALAGDYHFRVKDRETTRTNLVTAFQYQVNDDLTLSIEANYAKFSRWFHEEKNSFQFKTNAKYYVDDSVFIDEPMSTPNEAVERFITSGVAFDGSQTLINFERETEDEAKGLNFQADWIINANWDMQLKATYSENSFEWTPNDKAHQSMKRDGVPMVYQTDVNGGMPEIYFLNSDIDAGGYMFNYAQYPNFDINDKNTWAPAIDATANENNEYLSNAQSADTKDNSVETATLGTDFTYYMDNSDYFNLIKFGFKYTNNESHFASQTTNNKKVFPASNFKEDFSLDDLGELTATEEFMGGHNYQGIPLTWQSWNWDTFNDIVWNSGAGTWPGLGITDIPAFMALDVQHVTELNSIAAYAMTSFEVGQLSGNVGVRYVYDDYEAYSYNLKDELVDSMEAMVYLPGEAPEGEDSINEEAMAAWNNPDNFNKLTGGRQEDYLLPSFNARYTLAEDLFLRFSAALTMNRAPYAATKAKANFSYGEDDESGDDILYINGQNPALEPTFSRNYNLGIEWYLPKQGSVTLAVRHKNLYNVRSKEEVELELDENPFTGEPLTVDKVRITRQANDGSGTVDTVEFGVRQKLKFLPGFLQHTGFNFNTSYSESDVTKPTTNGKAKLPRPPKVGFNAQLYYQHKAVTARLSYKWREERLTRAANDNSLATLDDYRRNLDFSTSYKFNKNFKVSFNVRNVLEENHRRIAEEGGLLVGEVYNSRHFMLTGHYTM